MHPGAGNRQGTLVQGLLARYPELAGIGGDRDRPGIVHRLDKGTSGLLLVARSPEAYDALVAQLQAHEVERRYLALVWGELDALERHDRRPDRPLDPRAHPHGRVDHGARRPAPATRWCRPSPSPCRSSLLECRLETGRTHQIRVHLTAIDHPVVGDGRYGGDRSSFPVERPWLHAAALRPRPPGHRRAARLRVAAARRPRGLARQLS